jgi:hypothetical protein
MRKHLGTCGALTRRSRPICVNGAVFEVVPGASEEKRKIAQAGRGLLQGPFVPDLATARRLNWARQP